MSGILENYNKEEEFLYSKPFNFIKGYATGLKLTNTLKALPLARQFHNGQYRKGNTNIDGVEYKTPYILHVLRVCSTLISIVGTTMPNEELDILLTSALLHDTLEDCKQFFPLGGQELVLNYGFPKEVYTVVSLVTKSAGYTDEQLLDYFNKIKKNKYAILVKLADRSHNVEDLYNMPTDKLHKYVRETRQFVYPLASYGKQAYPEFSNAFTDIKSKIISLTENSEVLVNKYEGVVSRKDKEIASLKAEVERLKAELEKGN
jgi:GTP pyrophosphokinase